jgi:hypothetical protein
MVAMTIELKVGVAKGRTLRVDSWRPVFECRNLHRSARRAPLNNSATNRRCAALSQRHGCRQLRASCIDDTLKNEA